MTKKSSKSSQSIVSPARGDAKAEHDVSIEDAKHASAKTIESNNSEVQKLRNKITDMDALSQEGCGEISSIARLASASLEVAIVKGDFNDIAAALLMISQKAGDIENCINAEAEKVGCNHVNEFRRNRRDRLQIARNKAAEASGA